MRGRSGHSVPIVMIGLTEHLYQHPAAMARSTQTMARMSPSVGTGPGQDTPQPVAIGLDHALGRHDPGPYGMI